MKYDQHTITKNGIVEVRYKKESGEYHRRAIAPGEDFSKEPQEVQDICKKAHTKKVIDAYKKQMQENEL